MATVIINITTFGTAINISISAVTADTPVNIYTTTATFSATAAITAANVTNFAALLLIL